ncbi:MAG: hypothetical protein II666_10275, partial [Butyrivibrio sp.]|nr:hypothetical protein [Butyrivibrio sp.]
VSLRTYPPLDASEICKRLGGGGHKGAAGASVSGTLETLDFSDFSEKIRGVVRIYVVFLSISPQL